MSFSFILGAKPGDHGCLFDNFMTGCDLGLVQSIQTEGIGKTLASTTQLHDHLQLNASNLELGVKFMQHVEFAADGEVGGRCRWKIENETFNTLRNQGYQLDHHFEHGEKNLSTVFATLMFLAFLVDQIQQLCCPLFAEAMGRFNTGRAYWHHLRFLFTPRPCSWLNQIKI